MYTCCDTYKVLTVIFYTNARELQFTLLRNCIYNYETGFLGITFSNAHTIRSSTKNILHNICKRFLYIILKLHLINLSQ